MKNRAVYKSSGQAEVKLKRTAAEVALTCHSARRRTKPLPESDSDEEGETSEKEQSGTRVESDSDCGKNLPSLIVSDF